MINYTKLLRIFVKYIDHVGQCTGRVYLSEIPPDRDGKTIEDQSKVDFDPDEFEFLRQLAKEGWEGAAVHSLHERPSPAERNIMAQRFRRMVPRFEIP